MTVPPYANSPSAIRRRAARVDAKQIVQDGSIGGKTIRETHVKRFDFKRHSHLSIFLIKLIPTTSSISTCKPSTSSFNASYPRHIH